MPRGWRLRKRKDVDWYFSIDGKGFVTKNFSERGAYVVWPDCKYNLTDEVSIEFELDKQKIEVRGGIARKDEQGVGIAFRGIDSRTRKMFRKFKNAGS